MLHGLDGRLEPPPLLTGNAYLQEGEPLPTTWAQAIDKFAQSEFARAALGPAFVSLFSAVKRAEMEEFNSFVTPLEISRYLGPL
jgi:glutamine synthetase